MTEPTKPSELAPANAAPPSPSAPAPAPAPTDGPERILIKYAVLVGLTPLIPVPLLDDVAQGYFERRMIERLASGRRLALSTEQLDDLAAPPVSLGGRLKGCLTTLVLYPLSKLLRKIFFFLEIKRALDLVAATYVRGHLLDRAFRRHPLAPAGAHAPADVRRATERAIERVGTSPVGLALRGSFKDSTALLARLAEHLFASLRRLPRAASKAEVAAVARAAEEHADPALEGVEARVEQGLKDVPPDHFERLEAALDEELSRPGS